MVWNSTWPDVTKSVKANGTTGTQNTAYIETNMNKDHYWKIGVDEDGHHQFMQTVATNDDDSSLETNPSLDTGMDLVYFSRFKTATESVTQQDTQPYASNVDTTGIMQLLGMRACALFNVVGGVVTVVYKHNVTSVTRTSGGAFTVAFDHDLPSADYLVLGGGIDPSGNSGINVSVPSPVSNKAVGSCKIIALHIGSGVPTDALQAWVIMFGG